MPQIDLALVLEHAELYAQKWETEALDHRKFAGFSDQPELERTERDRARECDLRASAIRAFAESLSQLR